MTIKHQVWLLSWGDLKLSIKWDWEDSSVNQTSFLSFKHEELDLIPQIPCTSHGSIHLQTQHWGGAKRKSPGYPVQPVQTAWGVSDQWQNLTHKNKTKIFMVVRADLQVTLRDKVSHWTWNSSIPLGFLPMSPGGGGLVSPLPHCWGYRDKLPCLGLHGS